VCARRGGRPGALAVKGRLAPALRPALVPVGVHAATKRSEPLYLRSDAAGPAPPAECAVATGDEVRRYQRAPAGAYLTDCPCSINQPPKESRLPRGIEAILRSAHTRIPAPHPAES